MSYTKMTVDDFKKRLKEGHYQNATGARRGAGKADMSDEDKAKCYKAIDAQFGEATPSTEKKAAPAVTKKPKAQAKKVVKVKGVKAEPKAEPVKKGPGRRRRTSETTTSEVADAHALAQLHLAKERIGTIMQAVGVMKSAKEAYPSLDTQAGSVAAMSALTDIMQNVHNTIRGEQDVDPRAAELLQRTAAAAQGIPQLQPQQVPDNSVAAPQLS